MKQRQEIEQKINEALNSLDGMERATPQPWFYTRLRGRMQREEGTSWNAVGSFLSRPVVAIAGLCVILVMNVYFLVYQPNSGKPANVVLQNEMSSDSESMIASTSSFDYENIAP